MTRYDQHPQAHDDARTGPQASREAAGRDETASRVSGDGQGLRGALEALADYASTRGGDYQDQAGRHGRSAMGEAAAAAARAWWEASSRLRAVLAAHPAPEPGREQMEALIERSSRGTPEAKRLRDSVPREAVDRIMARVRELEESEPAADPGGDAADLEAEVERLRDRALGDEQCCLDTCNGGACETCPGCSAGWCVNGHDFAADPGVWEQMMSEEDHQLWFDVAREHNRGIDAALIRAEAAEARTRRAEDALRAVYEETTRIDAYWGPDGLLAFARRVAQIAYAGQTSDATPSDACTTCGQPPDALTAIFKDGSNAYATAYTLRRWADESETTATEESL